MDNNTGIVAVILFSMLFGLIAYAAHLRWSRDYTDNLRLEKEVSRLEHELDTTRRQLEVCGEILNQYAAMSMDKRKRYQEIGDDGELVDGADVRAQWIEQLKRQAPL